MRPAAPARNRIHAFDALGAHAEQPIVGDGDEFVLLRARPDRAADIDIGRIDHRRRHLEQLDLVRGLDLARVEQRLLAVDHFDALGLERAQHADFHHVDAERLLVDAVVHERLLDLLGEIVLHVHRRRDRALHGRDRRGDIVGNPGRGNALGGRRRVPQERLAFGRAQRIAEELVARPFADMRGRDIADIIEIEAEHGAEAGVADRGLCARQPLFRQAAVVDALLPVFGHRAKGGGGMRAVVLHRSSLEF